MKFMNTKNVDVTIAGHLQDFDGKPVLASCINCQWNMDQSDGPEYGGAWYACEKPGKEHMSNLKGFPFKTAQKCFELHIAYTVDWDSESKKQQWMQSEIK